MLPFTFAFVAGFASNAAILHAQCADLPRAGVRSIAPSTQMVPCMRAAGRWPLVVAGASGILPTVRRSKISVMGAGFKTWEDIVKESPFNRVATPAEFCQQIEQVKFDERGDVAHVLYSPFANGCSFSDEAFAELLRRGYTGESPHSCDSWSMDMRTDPIALALLDEKGSEWCMKHSFATIEKKAVPIRFADFVEIEGRGSGEFPGSELVVVNFDEAFRYGIGMILDNESSTMDHVRAWEAIISFGAEAWPCNAETCSTTRWTL